MLRRVQAVLVTGVVGLAVAPLLGAPDEVAGAATSSTPIIVGGDSSLSLNEGLSQGFEAGIYRFNKAGGLDGRKIQFVGSLDDGFSPSTSLSNAQQLVEKDHVMVVAPVSSDGGTAATGNFLAQQKVPFIGYETNPMFTADPQWGWGIDGNQVTGSIQGAALWKNILTVTGNTGTPGKVKIALMGNDYPTAVAGVKELSGLSTYDGMKVVLSESPIPIIGTTNYQPYAQAIVSSGANAVYMVTSHADAVGVAAALKAANWKGALFDPTGYTPGVKATPSALAAANGTYVTSQFPVAANTPAVKQAEKDLESVGQAPNLTAGTSIGYWTAIFLEQLLRATLTRVGGNPNLVTSAELEKTVNSGWAYTDPLAGGIGTEYFPAAEKIPTSCSAFAKVSGSNFNVVIPYKCGPIVDLNSKKAVNQKTGSE